LENIAYLRETLKIHKFSINSFSKYYLHNLASYIHFSKTCNLFYRMLTVSPGWSSWIPKCATKQRERENLPFRMGFSRALSLTLALLAPLPIPMPAYNRISLSLSRAANAKPKFTLFFAALRFSTRPRK